MQDCFGRADTGIENWFKSKAKKNPKFTFIYDNFARIQLKFNRRMQFYEMLKSIDNFPFFTEILFIGADVKFIRIHRIITLNLVRLNR